MNKILFSILLTSIVSLSQASENVIIPRPLKMIIAEKNAVFFMNKNTSIIADSDFISEAKNLAVYLNKVTGFAISVKQKADQSSLETLIFIKLIGTGSIPKEGYVMDVSDKIIQIQASHPAGAYYGCMSLLQMLKYIHSSSGFTVAPCHIEDQPRFAWRGLMLDCSRTFLSIEYIKKTIDRMSFYKLNTLHLHLTDDQGWRLEIKRLPLLTSKGAFFATNYNEPKEFEGFYTQVQIRELISYANQKHVEIVPEIEVPGHSHAALYAYPELSCSGNITPIFPFSGGPNMTANDVFCSGNENTYRFFNDVIKEVVKLFPSRYIHFGGDEVGEGAWKDCKKCQAKMTSLGISDQKHLQDYIMKRVGNYILAANKRPIGWDEVFQAGVGKETVLMIWRELDNGIKEVKAGYDVILTTTANLYFDYSYSTTPTRKVYSFEPTPGNITSEQEKHYLGIQANFWSHIDRTEAKIDYQIFPRLLAMAERAWSDKSVTDYDNFYQRLLKQEFWLKYFDVKYHSLEE